MAKGRKSRASLSVAPVTELKRPPEPPERLTAGQSETWRVIMSSSAGNFIQAEVHPVLVEYCRAVESANKVALQLDVFLPDWAKDEEGLKRWDKLHAMQDRVSRRVSSLAVKLRLTPSSRVHRESAGAAERNHSNHKPWQFEG